MIRRIIAWLVTPLILYIDEQRRKRAAMEEEPEFSRILRESIRRVEEANGAACTCCGRPYQDSAPWTRPESLTREIVLRDRARSEAEQAEMEKIWRHLWESQRAELMMNACVELVARKHVAAEVDRVIAEGKIVSVWPSATWLDPELQQAADAILAAARRKEEEVIAEALGIDPAAPGKCQGCGQQTSTPRGPIGTFCCEHCRITDGLGHSGDCASPAAKRGAEPPVQ